MNKDRVRWGIISTARIGSKAVVPAIAGARFSALHAVASRSAPGAERYAAEFSIPRFYGSYEELLDDDSVDAVYLPLPNSLHEEWVVRSAEAGKHVLCEKPLGVNAEQCAVMEEAAKANGVVLMEAFMYRYHPRTQAIVELVHSGGLGAVQLVQATFTFRVGSTEDIRLRRELGGGALLDVGCYCVDIGRMLIGSGPTYAEAFATWSDSGVDDLMVGEVHFAGGEILQFDCSLRLPRRERYHVVGTEGFLDVPNSFLPGPAPARATLHRDGSQPEVLHYQAANQYQLMVEDFCRQVLTAQTRDVDTEYARRNLQVIDALFESARQDGRRVAISL